MLCTGTIKKSKLALAEDQKKWELKCQLTRTQTAQAQDEVSTLLHDLTVATNYAPHIVWGCIGIDKVCIGIA